MVAFSSDLVAATDLAIETDQNRFSVFVHPTRSKLALSFEQQI